MAFAFFFDSVSGGEWLVLLAVILIVVGPKNLPATARKIGQIMTQLRRAADEFKRQLMAMDQEVQKTVEDVKQQYMDVGQEVQDTVADDGTSIPSDDVSPEDEDRAMWESYGRDYDDPDGIYGYGDGSQETDGEQVASADAPAETGAQAAPAPEEETSAETELVS